MSNPSKKVKTVAMAESTKCVNTIRVLAADMVQAANSGHPGAPMGCAPMAHALWTQVMNYSPSDPKWVNRDRFVLSNGHGCALQYAMLHLTGYNVTLDDLKQFRQLGSKTPGHPENFHTEGVEVSTGPLGQGISNAVGLAIAETHLAAQFNKPDAKIVDHHTYVICGDGCLQEGVASEACSLAGHLALGKLIVLYDDNLIQIDGSTELAFTEDVNARFESYGWHTQSIADGDSADPAAILKAVEAAKAVTDKPSIIKIRTTIGLGSSKQATEKVHGAPLGADDLASVKKLYGFNPEDSFIVPDEVRTIFTACKTEGDAKAAAWKASFEQYKAKYPKDAAEFQRRIDGELPAGWEDSLPVYTPESKTLATRKYSFEVLEKIIAAIPEFIGGSADLTGSNLTKVEANKQDYQKDTPEGRYFRFGVREHGMAAICNGMAAHGGIIPFASTFLVFAGYALGSIRLSALSKFKVVYILTHDSIGLGEDGPTHQPVETLISLRAIPNMLVFRPADGNETSGCYKVALNQKGRPSTLALTRQNCKNQAGSSIDAVAKGGYILASEEGAQIVLAATGSEVGIAVEAAAALKAEGIKANVVSFPCLELFEEQDEAYRKSVLPSPLPVLAIEAASDRGWAKYSHAQISMTTFGISAPGPACFKHFGFTKENVVEKAKKLMAYYKDGAPNLIHPAF